MGTPTYTPLANLTLGSSAASVTFSSISQTYRDLVLVVNAGGTSAGAGVMVRANGDTGVNFYSVEMRGNGSTTGAASFTSDAWSGYTGITSTVAFNAQYQIFDYSATDKHKSALSRQNDSSSLVEAVAHRWANTAAITTLLIYPGGGSFTAGSSFALYGIAA